MALRNRSVATVDAPEFINLEQDAINPGISKCDIKVFYLGKNRNGSYIDKNMAIQMANSLPGTPIVAAYREEKEDFGDHGQVVTIEDGEIKFSCKTIPYGFVAPDAEVWFKKFNDTDEFGNQTEREYVMTTGYLWTGQYPELDKVISEGQPHSMEIDEVDGHWATDSKDGIDFFIINDAVFTKLCILGDDVEPCFEGSSVTAHEERFAYEKNFSCTLFTMMNELKTALNSEGGSYMSNENVEAPENTVFEAVEEVEEAAVDETPEVAEEVAPAADEVVEDAEAQETDDTAEEFAKDDKKEEEEKPSDDEEGEDSAPESDDSEEDKKDDDEEKKKPSNKNSLEEVQTQLSELQTEYAALQKEVEDLRAFKAARDTEDKQALIDKYHMLSAEDKADVVAHMSEYSLSDIEAKLALIYVQKNVDFETVDGQAEVDAPAEVSPITTFSLDDETQIEAGEDLFLNALRETKIL